ncbi:DgyrCDS1042 [Dimorphilus gyrociliatus]|uniref:Choline transporter-like protein n=1 Tax=Dimorphilus gyrociliatus TaxID=2664684 RepID=A0A7I8V7J9_9ANNE|nr:DgyrCDS1042 [Dimorphilus gyrociliatus]
MTCCGEESDGNGLPKESLKVQKQGFTDIPCCLIFLVFVGGMGYIAAHAFINGDIYRLYYGYDSYGNTCGRKNSKIESLQKFNISNNGRDMTDKTKVFFLDIKNFKSAISLCVKKCPESTLSSNKDIKNFAEKADSNLCTYETDVDEYESQANGKLGPCPSLPVLASTSILSRCVPDLLKAKKTLDQANRTRLGNVLTEYFSEVSEFLRESVLDFVKKWKEVLIVCAITIVLAFIFVFILRFIASVVAYLSMIIAVVGAIAGTLFVWWKFYDIIKREEKLKDYSIPFINLDVSNKKVFLGLGIFFSICTIILILIVVVMFKRIRLVAALFHEAGKVFMNTPTLLFQPVWTLLVLGVYLLFWAMSMAFLVSSEPPKYRNDTMTVEFKRDTKLTIFYAYYFVALIWICEFIIACQQMVVAGTVTDWYFDREKEFATFRVLRSTKNLILFHLGSVAFGSFIILLVKLPRAILMYIDQKTRGKKTKCAEFMLKCCQCCLWCLEKALKFLNENAYTIITIRKTNFCKSACIALKIIASNILRVSAINCVGNFILFLGKIGITAIGVGVTIVWLKFVRGVDVGSRDDLELWGIPVVFMCVFSFLIAHCFLSVYDMVIDSLLLCFCEDMRINDGSEEKPYFMNKSLLVGTFLDLSFFFQPKIVFSKDNNYRSITNLIEIASR